MKALLSCVLLLAQVALAEVSVEDFAGRQVTMAQPAKRIIALAPHIVENLFSAGAGDKLVGVVSYSDYPPPAREISQVGSYNAFSLEQIIALQPDLVVMWGSGNGGAALSQLQRLGIPVYVSEIRQLQQLPQSIRRLGLLAGTSTVADAEARRLELELHQLRERFGTRERVSVFYEIWNEPLQTVNGEHLISQVIELCGGSNVFADQLSLAPRIGVESVLQSNPQAIVASGMGEARPEWLDQWRRYPALRAVAAEALFFIDPDHIQRPTARILQGAQRLCEQLDSIRPAALQ